VNDLPKGEQAGRLARAASIVSLLLTRNPTGNPQPSTSGTRPLLDKLRNQMDRLWIAIRDGFEAELAETFSIAAFSGRTSAVSSRNPGSPASLARWRNQDRADATPCQASMTTNAISARPGSKTILAGASGDDLPACFLGEHDQCDMIPESMSMKNASSLSEKWRFITKNRRWSDCALVFSSAASMSALSSGRSADFDRAAVAQVLVGAVVGDVRIGALLQEARQIDLTRSSLMKPPADRVRLIWIKIAARKTAATLAAACVAMDKARS